MKYILIVVLLALITFNLPLSSRVIQKYGLFDNDSQIDTLLILSDPLKGYILKSIYWGSKNQFHERTLFKESNLIEAHYGLTIMKLNQDKLDDIIIQVSGYKYENEEKVKVNEYHTLFGQRNLRMSEVIQLDSFPKEIQTKDLKELNFIRSTGYYDRSLKKSIILNEVDFEIDDATKIDENLDINIYPNPANQSINLIITGNKNHTEYTIFSITGETVKKGILISGINNIDISELPSSVYIIRIIIEGNKIDRKIVIER